MNHVVYAIHSRAISQQAFYSAAAEHLLRSGELAGHRGAAASAIDGKPQFLHIKGLFQKIYCAVAKKLQSGGHVLTPSESDDWRRERKLGG